MRFDSPSHNFPHIKYNKIMLFHSCHLAKQCRLSFPDSNLHSSHIFELVHVDIWGAITIQSLDGFQYF